MNEFKAFLQQKDLAPITQEVYIRNVQRFLQWYGQDPLNATTKDVLQYLEYLQQGLHLETLSRRNHLIALHHYFAFLQCPAVTAFTRLNAPKKHRIPYIFTLEELGQLYDDYYDVFIQKTKPKGKLLTHWRNYIMLGFLVYQGLRTSELDGLALEDINVPKAVLHVCPQGRRGNPRNMPLQACQIGSVMYYVETVRPSFTNNEEEPKLFLPLPEAVLTGNRENTSIRSALRHLHRNLKTLHNEYDKVTQLRTSVITHWIRNQGLRKAQYLAGHKSIVSTEEYVANDLEALTDDLSKYHPF